MADGEVTPSQAMCLLDTMEDGQFRVTLDESVEDLIKGLRKHQNNAGGKAKGQLSMTISAVFDGKHVMLKGEVAVKLPKPIRGESLYYATKDNGLTREDPRQHSLPLQDATKQDDTRPMKVV
jgi:hypothetical protein